MSGTYLILGATSPIAIHLVKAISSNKERSTIYLLARNSSRLKSLKAHVETISGSKVILHEFDLSSSVRDYDYPANINYFIHLAGVNLGENTSIEDSININYTQPLLFTENLIARNAESLRSVLITTSIAGVRGRAFNYIYGSSKAALIAYASGLRQKHNKQFTVTTFIPGYMDTEMLNGMKTPGFLVSSPANIARLIFRSISKKKNVVYSKFAWWVIAVIITHVPEFIFKKISK